MIYFKTMSKGQSSNAFMISLRKESLAASVNYKWEIWETVLHR